MPRKRCLEDEGRDEKGPRLRFRGFSEDWELCKLGTLAEIVRGASPRPIQDSKWFDNTSDVGWLRISDVTEQNGRIYKLEQNFQKPAKKNESFKKTTFTVKYCSNSR